MDYIEKLVHFDDFREINREVFKMDLVYKFNNSTYIDEYDCIDINYGDSDDDYEEEKKFGDENTNISDNPFKTSSESQKSKNKKRLSKEVDAALNGFSSIWSKT